MGNVSIFDNLNTYIDQVVTVVKNVGHCLYAIPALIIETGTRVADFLEYCPPFIAWTILFSLGTGIIMKGAHWGS